MASKTQKAKKTVIVTKTQPKENSTGSNGASGGVPTADTTHKPIYTNAVNEISHLSENDAAGRKVDSGPLAEARGKDTWRLHAQVLAIDQATERTEGLIGTVQNSLHELDGSLDSISGKLTSNREAVQSWITTTRSDLAKAIQTTEANVTEAISKAQGAVNRNVKEGTTDTATRLDTLLSTVKESFAKLAKATAGSEENLRAQTDSFSKAVEHLVKDVQTQLERRITEFRDEATRQVDKRFNQSDVAFAAVRADQEVIKALLTDIIKDRMGRSEPKMR